MSEVTFAARQQPPLVKATSLGQLYLAFRPEPLREEELDKFYCEGINATRRLHWRERLVNDFKKSIGIIPLKALLAGHEGSGKSTEIAQIERRLARDFQITVLDAQRDLNPQRFRVSDFLWVLLLRVIEECKPPAETTLRADIERAIRDQFPEAVESAAREREVGGGLEVDSGGALTALLGPLAPKVKASIQFKSKQKQEETLDPNRVSDLLHLVNRVLAVCRVHGDREILIIGENFDKRGIPPEFLVEVFADYAEVFRQMDCSALFTLPVALCFSEHSTRLPFPNDARVILYDTPVFDEQKKEDAKGVAAIQQSVLQRADGSLFAEGVLALLVCASGGNLRSLFSMIRHAGDLAEIRVTSKGSTPRIEKEEARIAIDAEAEQLIQTLGGSIYNDGGEAFSDELKYGKLIAIYKGEVKTPDPMVYALLRRRAVLYHNGQGRYAVHPLIVNLLRRMADQLKFEYQGGGVDIPEN